MISNSIVLDDDIDQEFNIDKALNDDMPVTYSMFGSTESATSLKQQKTSVTNIKYKNLNSYVYNDSVLSSNVGVLICYSAEVIADNKVNSDIGLKPIIKNFLSTSSLGYAHSIPFSTNSIMASNISKWPQDAVASLSLLNWHNIMDNAGICEVFNYTFCSGQNNNYWRGLLTLYYDTYGNLHLYQDNGGLTIAKSTNTSAMLPLDQACIVQSNGLSFAGSLFNNVIYNPGTVIGYNSYLTNDGVQWAISLDAKQFSGFLATPVTGAPRNAQYMLPQANDVLFLNIGNIWRLACNKAAGNFNYIDGARLFNIFDCHFCFKPSIVRGVGSVSIDLIVNNMALTISKFIETAFSEYTDSGEIKTFAEYLYDIITPGGDNGLLVTTLAAITQPLEQLCGMQFNSIGSVLGFLNYSASWQSLDFIETRYNSLNIDNVTFRDVLVVSDAWHSVTELVSTTINGTIYNYNDPSNSWCLSSVIDKDNWIEIYNRGFADSNASWSPEHIALPTVIGSSELFQVYDLPIMVRTNLINLKRII